VEHRGDVALVRQREEHDAAAAALFLSGHRLWSLDGGDRLWWQIDNARSADGDTGLVRSKQ
jgi:hypothetical protein